MALIEVNGTSLAYAEAGRGETVVLLHCTGSSSAQWLPLLGQLAMDHHVLAPDLHGYGSTGPWPGQGPLTLAHEAALVSGLLAAHGEPAHLVGHSYGGAVALRLALDHPEQVSSLTLIEPASFHLLDNGAAADRMLFQEILGVAEAVWRAAVSGDHAGGLERFVDYWNGAGAWARLRPDAQAALVRRIGTIAQNFWSTTTDPASFVTCHGVEAPVLVLAGGRSPATTRRICRGIAAAIPGARLETVEDAGHMLPISHGPRLAAALARHLGRHAVGTLARAA